MPIAQMMPEADETFEKFEDQRTKWSFSRFERFQISTPFSFMVVNRIFLPVSVSKLLGDARVRISFGPLSRSVIGCPSFSNLPKFTSSERMTVSAFTFNELTVTCAQVNQCSFSSWSPFFASHITEAEVLKDIPDAFLEYLNSDSIRLPPPKYGNKVSADSDNEYSDWEEDDVGQESPCAEFAGFDEKVQKAISKYQHVMPKLNWSAPKDARWILINNSLQCMSNADVYLLLNASDHIAHDLDGHIYDDCEDKAEGPHLKPELVLKKWTRDFNPALEFRIFVKNKNLLGVSQRDLNHYQFLQDLHPKIHALLETFSDNVIAKSRFPLRNYVMDVYIPAPHEKVLIVDINPFSRKWDSLLFTWRELLEKEHDGAFELRLITETNLGAMARKEHSENQVPIEVVDASVNTETMVKLAKTWGLKDKGEPNE